MTLDALHTFWFGDGRAPRAFWFDKDPAVDREVTARFAGLLGDAALEPTTTSRRRVAAVLLYDQVPRHVFRGDARSFAYDARARSLTQRGLGDGSIDRLAALEAYFFLLPLEHSEAIADQRAFGAALARLLPKAPPDQEAFFQDAIDVARRHERIIARFGRFPHRNDVLGRTSTDAEIAFLEEPGSRF